ncbi:MAG: membrane protein insertase YidC [Pseudomonadota bacterium]
MDEQNRNMLLAAVLSFVVIFGWFIIFPPEPQTQFDLPPPTDSTQVAPGQPAPAILPGIAPTPELRRDEALEQTARVAVETPRLTGSISLKGGRIDDLSLTDYRVDLDPESANVELFSPSGAPNPYLATYGWLATRQNLGINTPDGNTVWEIEAGRALAPNRPVALVWDNEDGLIFRREISVDENYMFTVRQSVENTTDQDISLAPFGYIAQIGVPDDIIGFFILHEGAVGAADGVSHNYTYEGGWITDSMADFELDTSEAAQVEKVTVSETGWLGFTGKYWASALIPQKGQQFVQVYKYLETDGRQEFRTEMRMPAISIPAGTTQEVETNLFAGAKEMELLRDYERDLGIERFDYMVDWGWFWFLTRPIFDVLHWLNIQIGNMGWSIIILTLIFKTLLFPLAWKSYVSMSKMKKLQPEMEKIKERAGDDRMKLQQEMMALYKKEKVNPAAGCLPILLQIPIFFSLYKVLFVTIEVRQAPFILWIEDLSVRDPTSVLNLFGLLPYAPPDPTSFLSIFSIGVFPILMGVTMWMQQKLNPAPTDPTQAMIFAWIPWVFMFMLGQFASGLVIYWCANNILTFAQQYAIMRSQGVEIDFFGNVKKSFKRKKTGT